MKRRKLVVGLLVLVPLCVLALLALALLVRDVAAAGGWRTPLFLGFAGGVAAWLLLWPVLPRTTLLYVFGHEATHAIWAWCFGGTVLDFKVRADGGYVRTDRVNCWVVLAPYFFPFYALLAAWLWWLASFWVNLDAYAWAVAGLVGAGWAFHVSYTFLVLGRVQSDITSQGWVFSLALILLMNVVPATVCLALAAHEVGGWGLLLAYREAAWWIWDAVACILNGTPQS